MLNNPKASPQQNKPISITNSNLSLKLEHSTIINSTKSVMRMHIAIYHCNIKIISRGKGKSAVAAAAYRSGAEITNKRDSEIHDYTRKGGVINTVILLPDHVPTEYADRSILWNAVEKIKMAKTSQLARGIEISLPAQLARDKIFLVRVNM